MNKYMRWAGLALLALVTAGCGGNSSSGLPTSATVQGSLVNGQRTPEPGATVELWVMTKGGSSGMPYAAVSDSHGRFTIDQVPPGYYTLQVSAPDRKAYTVKDPNVSVNGNLNIEVKVERPQ